MNALSRHLPATLQKRLKRAGSTGGGEYKGPCPWCGGEDRFCVSPAKGESGLWRCRQCGRGGDGIALLRSDAGGGLSFAEACHALRLEGKIGADSCGDQSHAQSAGQPVRREVPAGKSSGSLLHPPGDLWQKKARGFVEECRRALWADTGAAGVARRYLAERGFSERTMRAAKLGVNLKKRYPLRTSWGLRPKESKANGGAVWLPRGIVIPWWISGTLWKVNIRRRVCDVEEKGGPKYVQAAGKRCADGDAPAWSTNALYAADGLGSDRPAVLVEGELDALAVWQAAEDTASPVATGSTGGARRPRWIGKLSQCCPVLLAFDAEGPGERAARYWQDTLPDEARPVRWRPYWQDPAAMLETGADVRAWVRSGLRHAESS